MLALVFHNTGVMGKLWAESMDESDRGPLEALAVAGASRSQIAVHAVLPVMLPVAGRAAAVPAGRERAIVARARPGRRGRHRFLINQSIRLFRFDEMVTHILVVLVLVVAVDQLSSFVRRRLGV